MIAFLDNKPTSGLKLDTSSTGGSGGSNASDIADDKTIAAALASGNLSKLNQATINDLLKKPEKLDEKQIEQLRAHAAKTMNEKRDVDPTKDAASVEHQNELNQQKKEIKPETAPIIEPEEKTKTHLDVADELAKKAGQKAFDKGLNAWDIADASMAARREASLKTKEQLGISEDPKDKGAEGKEPAGNSLNAAAAAAVANVRGLFSGALNVSDGQTVSPDTNSPAQAIAQVQTRNSQNLPG